MRLLYNLQKEIKNPEFKSILDLGCGKGMFLKEALKGKYSVGVDNCKIDLNNSKKNKVYNKCILGDITKMSFPEKSFDLVTSFHVLEHLTKEQGRKVIKKMAKIARKAILINTPNGFLRLDDYDFGHNYTGHKCGWTVQEFKELGFEVIGVDGIKYFGIRGIGFFRKQYKKSKIWHIPFIIMELITNNIPFLGFHLSCIKRIDKK